MRCGQWDCLESFLIKLSHSLLHGFGLSGNHRHLWRVLVGCNNVALNRIEYGCNFIVRSHDACHQAFVFDNNRTHFRAASSRCSQCAVHVQNTCRHESSIFAEGMACNHIGVLAVVVQCPFNGQISREHCRLSILGLLQFVFCFNALFFG